jgi:hypothetical protein
MWASRHDGVAVPTAVPVCVEVMCCAGNKTLDCCVETESKLLLADEGAGAEAEKQAGSAGAEAEMVGTS